MALNKYKIVGVGVSGLDASKVNVNVVIYNDIHVEETAQNLCFQLDPAGKNAAQLLTALDTAITARIAGFPTSDITGQQGVERSIA